MNTLRELENVFFHFGFKKCIKNISVNFLKIKENQYLVFRIYSNNRIADLFIEEYNNGENPCNGNYESSKTIKLGFEKDNDLDLIKKTLNLL